MATGTLRIAALPALAVSFLPRVIAAFRETHPGVTVQLQTRSSSTVRQWMANQQFDIGLATPARELPGIRMERFLRCPGACVLPAGPRLAVKDVIRPPAPEGEPFLSLAPEDGVRPHTAPIFEDPGVHRLLFFSPPNSITLP